MDYLRRITSSLPIGAAALLVATCLAGARVGSADAAPLSAGHSSSASRILVTPPSLSIPLPAPDARGKIKHVVIIMQENRSFDNLFQGYPGADTQSYGYDSHGNRVTLQPIGLEAPYDISHDINEFTVAYDNGKMDGFDKEPNSCPGRCTDPQYGYVPANESLTYFNMAHQYVLGDRMFTSHIDDSFISHQYIIAGQANGTAFFPNSYWGCDGGPGDMIPTLKQDRTFGPSIVVCWDIKTLGDELDTAHKTWRFYTSDINGDGGIWSSYQAIRHIRYGPDWTKDVLTPQSRVLTDVKGGALANVTWVMPTCTVSDHSGCGSTQGPAWVASIVNAVGQSKYWKSTAIFVLWDEWGGWYDHVAPPYVDYDGLGFRVPLLIVSPYAKQNYVSHIQYEHGSLLRFAEDQFALGRLSASDKRANSPASDAFDFTKPPRPFTPFTTSVSPEFFINARPDHRVPDSE